MCCLAWLRYPVSAEAMIDRQRYKHRHQIGSSVINHQWLNKANLDVNTSIKITQISQFLVLELQSSKGFILSSNGRGLNFGVTDTYFRWRLHTMPSFDFPRHYANEWQLIPVSIWNLKTFLVISVNIYKLVITLYLFIKLWNWKKTFSFLKTLQKTLIVYLELKRFVLGIH